jgi:hypothetical protein
MEERCRAQLVAERDAVWWHAKDSLIMALVPGNRKSLAL